MDATVIPARFPETVAAVAAAAQYVQQAWILAAGEAPLSPRQRTAYLFGLTRAESLLHPYQGDPLTAVVQNLSRLAQGVETGIPAVHLPTAIRWGQVRGARRSQRGRWYLLVPFRHGVPRSRTTSMSDTEMRSIMPQSVYQRARRLQPGQYLTSGPTRRGGPARHAAGMRPYVPRYARNIRPGYHHAAREERMVRRGGGRGRASTYLTFRTITPTSAGWWIPARPGLHLAREVERATTPLVQELIAEGVEADIQAALQGQTRR